MYREPILPCIFSCIFAFLPVCGRETESEWVKERDRNVGPSSCCGTVGEKVKEKDKDVDKKKRNLNGPIQLADPHREFTWGQYHALFVSPWRRASWVCASVHIDSRPASWCCYWFPHTLPQQFRGINKPVVKFSASNRVGVDLCRSCCVILLWFRLITHFGCSWSLTILKDISHVHTLHSSTTL